MQGCNAPQIEAVIREQTQREIDVAAGKVKRVALDGAPQPAAEEEVVVAEVVPVEEEESTMGTHEADKIVACLIIKPDALVQVSTQKVLEAKKFWTLGVSLWIFNSFVYDFADRQIFDF